MIRKTFYGGEGYDNVRMSDDGTPGPVGVIYHAVNMALTPVYAMAQIIKRFAIFLMMKKLPSVCIFLLLISFTKT